MCESRHWHDILSFSSDDLSNPDQIFVDNPFSISNSRFDPDLETKVIIHGWSHSRNVPWVVEMREGICNIFNTHPIWSFEVPRFAIVVAIA